MSKKEIIKVQDTKITIITSKENDYISLTDMAGYKDDLEARVLTFFSCSVVAKGNGAILRAGGLIQL